jgi:hypothetical protein
MAVRGTTYEGQTLSHWSTVAREETRLKKEYIPPALEEVGALPELTLGGSAGLRLDADFAAGTPFGELTFS